MRRYSVLYFVSQSLKGMWRNGLMTLAAITVLLSCLVLIGSFSALVYNVNENIAAVGMLNEIVVIVDYNATDAEVSDVASAIHGLDNVADVVYISKEEGLESERARYEEYSNLFEDIAGENPLPDVFKIKYKDNSRVANLVYQLKQIEHVSKVNNRIDIANDIENIKNGVSFVFIWFLIILFVVSIFIIINTIKIGVETRSKEISAMRYIGATNFFVSTPFVLEGIFIGIISAVIAFIAQGFLYDLIYDAVSNDYKMISVVPFAGLRAYFLAGFLVVGIFAGVLGSLISLRRYVKV